MDVSLEYVEDEEIYERVVEGGILKARTSLWISTANVKDMRVRLGRRYRSIVHVLVPDRVPERPLQPNGRGTEATEPVDRDESRFRGVAFLGESPEGCGARF